MTRHKLHHFKLGVSTKLHTNVHNLCISLVLYKVQKQENCVESSVTTADNMNTAKATLDFKIMMLSRKGLERLDQKSDVALVTKRVLVSRYKSSVPLRLHYIMWHKVIMRLL